MDPLNWFTPTPGTGALLDNRPIAEKQKDVSIVETVSSPAAVDWKEKPESEWRTFPDLNQNGSGSCVAQTLRKILGVLYWLKHGVFVDFSATHIYQRRSNRPAAGMIGVNAFEIAGDGVTLEVLVPSERMSDSQMDNAVVLPHHEEVGRVFSIGQPLDIPVSQIDLVASVIQHTGKAVMTWFYFTSSEWSQKVPTIKTNLQGPGDARSLRHSVAAVDFFLYKGKKAILIEDSAHFGGITRRIITEDFFETRNWFNHYPMNFKFEDPDSPTPKPKYKFKNGMSFIPLTSEGNISDPVKHAAQYEDVVAMQDLLRSLGHFPANIDSTGYYGAKTAEAVLKFQRATKITPASEIESLAGRLVGPKTITKLNSASK